MNYEIDSNGFVTFYNVPISRSGIFEYLGSQMPSHLNAEPNKIYKVYRPESALSNPDTIKSFNQVPWFAQHQMVGDDFVPAETANIQGTTGADTYYDANQKKLFTSMRLIGSSLKDAVKRGLKQLSCGMQCNYAWSSGVYDGQAYDIIQTDIVGNHIASVPHGRAGDEFAVAMDSAIDELESLTRNKGNQMTIEEMMAAVKEAQPAKEELKKLLAEIKSMVGDGESTTQEPAEDLEAPEVGEKTEVTDMSKDKYAMDAAAITQLVSDAVTAATAPLNEEIAKLKGSAMDERAIMKSINERNELGSKLSRVVGAFPYQEQTLEEVAKYGAEKLSIACDSGTEVIAVKAYLQACQKPAVTAVVAQDAADAPKSEILEKMGL